MKSGIYAITNAANGKRYIGSAVNLVNRWRGHRAALCRGDHRSVTLQRAWNKYGAASFEFSTLLICSPANVLFYEQRCIDGYGPEYNICKVAGSRLGTKYTPEARARLAVLRKAAPRSAKQLEHIDNLADAARGKAGRAHSPEDRAKISLSLTGKKQSPEVIEKRIAHQRGRPRTAEERAAISAGKTGLKRPPFSAEWRTKLGLTMKGRKHSPESIEKMSLAHKESWARRKTLQ